MSPDAPRYLLVDGHSIIHAWETLRRHHQRRQERYLAREILLRQMRLLQDVTGERVVVVFDGTGQRTSEEREPEGVQVFYSHTAQTADAIIERLAAKYAALYTIRVCTADRMIWETTRSFDAHWISPDDLQDAVERAERDLRKRIR